MCQRPQRLNEIAVGIGHRPPRGPLGRRTIPSPRWNLGRLATALGSLMGSVVRQQFVPACRRAAGAPIAALGVSGFGRAFSVRSGSHPTAEDRHRQQTAAQQTLGLGPSGAEQSPAPGGTWGAIGGCVAGRSVQTPGALSHEVGEGPQRFTLAKSDSTCWGRHGGLPLRHRCFRGSVAVLHHRASKGHKHALANPSHTPPLHRPLWQLSSSVQTSPAPKNRAQTSPSHQPEAHS